MESWRKVMTQATLNMDVLPDFFRDIEIVGPSHLELPKYRALHSKLKLTSTKKQVDVKAHSNPVLLASKSVKDAYQSNNFSKIALMEKQSQDDLQPIYTNVSTQKDKAWTKVKKDGKEFYMCWSDTGSMWSYTDSITQSETTDEDGNTTYQALVQIGSYTKTGKIAGIHTYNLTLPTLLAESVIAYIVARAVSGIIADGLGFLVTRFALYLAEAAAEAGLESFSFVVSEAFLAGVASCLVFAVVFIGLIYLWNWLNRKYTIRLQIFNWDENFAWNAAGQYMSNAKIAGEDSKVEFNLPKMVKPEDVVTPPGFDPVEALDAVCYYAVIIWENDNTFMEGCSMAIKMEREASSEGFMWAFDCPRFADNQQAASDGTKDPKAYRNSAPWNSKPLNFGITSTPDKTPVHFSVNALSGAEDDLYNVLININK